MGFQVLLGNNLINETLAFREHGGMKLPGKDNGQRILQPKQIGKSRGAAPCGQDAELRFWQADFRRGRVARDSPIAGKGEFVAAADAGSVDGGDSGVREIGDAVEKRLTGGDQAVETFAARCGELLEVGSGNKDIRFRGADQQAGDIGLLRKFIEPLRKLGESG